MAEFRYGNSALCCVLWKSFFEGTGGAEGEAARRMLEDLLLLRHHPSNRWLQPNQLTVYLVQTSPHVIGQTHETNFRFHKFNSIYFWMLMKLLMMDGITGTLNSAWREEDVLLLSASEQTNKKQNKEKPPDICGRTRFPPSGVLRLVLWPFLSLLLRSLYFRGR